MNIHYIYHFYYLLLYSRDIFESFIILFEMNKTEKIEGQTCAVIEHDKKHDNEVR